jgi:hypothetical protein
MTLSGWQQGCAAHFNWFIQSRGSKSKEINPDRKLSPLHHRNVNDGLWDQLSIFPAFIPFHCWTSWVFKHEMRKTFQTTDTIFSVRFSHLYAFVLSGTAGNIKQIPLTIASKSAESTPICAVHRPSGARLLNIQVTIPGDISSISLVILCSHKGLSQPIEWISTKATSSLI